MDLFASDLDNTLIFSHRHREAGDVCVERLEGREQSFCTARGLALLARVKERAEFIPVTTRSVEQYKRIQWPPDCAPRYAVTDNGGVLLCDGVRDPRWWEETRALAEPWEGALEQARELLSHIPMPGRWRLVDGLFLFAACDTPEGAQGAAELVQGRTGLELAVSGRKLYLLPPPLHKGEALRRLRERFRPRTVLCAGDSEMDLPMLRRAEIAILPQELTQKEALPGARVHRGRERFCEFVLQTALEGLILEKEYSSHECNRL